MTNTTPEAKRQRLEKIGADVLSRTKGYGKLILMGEHFVVYKVPALVGAVSAYTDCDAIFTEKPGLEVIDERPAVPNYKVTKKDEADVAIGLVLKHFGIDT